MNKLHVKSKLRNQKDVLETEENIPSSDDVADAVDTGIGLSIENGDIKTALDLKANLNGADFTGAITAPSIIENMSGYSYEMPSSSLLTINYAGIVKNGNKLTMVISGSIYAESDDTIPTNVAIGSFTIPSDILAKLYPTTIGGVDFLDNRALLLFNSYNSNIAKNAYTTKGSNYVQLAIVLGGVLTAETRYFFRYELTFLLSDNLVPQP